MHFWPSQLRNQDEEIGGVSLSARWTGLLLRGTSLQSSKEGRNRTMESRQRREVRSGPPRIEFRGGNTGKPEPGTIDAVALLVPELRMWATQMNCHWSRRHSRPGHSFCTIHARHSLQSPSGLWTLTPWTTLDREHGRWTVCAVSPEHPAEVMGSGCRNGVPAEWMLRCFMNGCTSKGAEVCSDPVKSWLQLNLVLVGNNLKPLGERCQARGGRDGACSAQWLFTMQREEAVDKDTDVTHNKNLLGGLAG